MIKYTLKWDNRGCHIFLLLAVSNVLIINLLSVNDVL